MEIEKIVISLGCIERNESINTCNGWGFGGHTGTKEFYSSGVIFNSCKKHHRHSGSHIDNSLFLPYKGETYVVEGTDYKHSIIKLLNAVYNVWEYNGHVRIVVAENEMPEYYKLIAKIDLVK